MNNNNKLFVGGLSWDTGEPELRSAFESFGEVREVRVITDRETGRSRGFGFVTFSEEDAASKAINEMNGKELDGRTIKVNIAEERQRSNNRGGGGGGGYRGGNGGGNRW